MPVITTAATVTCPHGGTVQLSTANSTVTADGAAVCLVSDQHTVSGCPFTTPSGVPSPCVSVHWSAPAADSAVGGAAPLLQTSSGLCLSGAKVPQGPAVVAGTQSAVKGV
ncbi:hypothetical protein [Kineococcus indalonis]|uniref:hypothetical protein n=1 Tax=Kineococcus indalonis TaxID=2696566 RepID=UPI003898F284